MNSKNIKLLRGQVKECVKDIFPEIFTREAQKNFLDQVKPVVLEQLKAIEEQVLEVARERQQQSAIKENELLKAAAVQLADMNLTLLAWQAVVAEKLEMASVLGDTFKAELEQKKKELTEKLEKENSSS